MLPTDLVKAYDGFVGSVQPEESVLGQQLSKKLGVLRCNYKYSVDGGAVGEINLRDVSTNAPAVVPKGAIIVNALMLVKTIVAGTGADASIGVNTAVDVFADAGTEGAPWSTTGIKQGVPDLATVGDMILTTADKPVVLTIEDAVLTAGEFDLYLFYVLS